jgi:hypothetical protein
VQGIKKGEEAKPVGYLPTIVQAKPLSCSTEELGLGVLLALDQQVWAIAVAILSHRRGSQMYALLPVTRLDEGIFRTVNPADWASGETLRM